MNGRVVLLTPEDYRELRSLADSAQTIEALRAVVVAVIDEVYNGTNGGHLVIDEDEE